MVRTAPLVLVVEEVCHRTFPTDLVETKHQDLDLVVVEVLVVLQLTQVEEKHCSAGRVVVEVLVVLHQVQVEVPTMW